MNSRALAAAALLAAGCGAVDANTKAKVEVSFQSSTHLWDDGAAIDGTLCWKSMHWDLGAVANANGVIELRATGRRYVVGPSGPSETRIVGGIMKGGGHGEDETIDLRFGPDHFAGRVGWHQYDLKSSGDHLEGTYQLNGMAPVAVKLYGIDKLFALPLAEQGVLLPSLLFCSNNSPTHDFEVDLRDLKRQR